MRNITIKITRLIIFALAPIAYAQAETGAEIYATQCASCHGQAAQGNQTLSAPRLAGQHAVYLQEQLINFKNGKRGSHSEDLNGKIMLASAVTLSSEQIFLVSSYLEKEQLEGSAIKSTASKDNPGKTIYASTCGDCHGEKGQGSTNLVSPNLAILSNWYLKNQFLAYSSGWRGNAELGTTRSMGMRAIMKQLGEAEQATVLEYLSNQ